MQKILICSDKYKGSLSSCEVNNAIHSGITTAKYPSLCDLVTVSDGGDGFLASIGNLEVLRFKSINALHQPINVEVGYKNNTAYIEVATIIGIAMLDDNTGSIWERSSLGLGKLIYTILDSTLQITKLVIGCGGSSTNDGGFGLLCGLGAKFYDQNQQLLTPSLRTIGDIETLDLNLLHPKLKDISIEIIADVKGGLIGTNGCTHLFAQQKGAHINDIPSIENSIIYLQQLLIKYTDIDINTCGYGLCAGGIAAALSILPQTQYFDGASWVIQHTNLELKIAYCDMVFSGEGKVDITSMHGKLIWHIAQLCKKHQKPLVIIAGQLECELEPLYQLGITCAFSITNKYNVTNFANSEKLITSRVANLFNFAAIV